MPRSALAFAPLSPRSHRLGLVAVLTSSALLGACASAPPALEPAVRMELGLPMVQAPLAPTVMAHLDGEPLGATEAQP
jgi:hypothetical protein